ncbi:hypothetical protein BAC3_01712 [uncultured bacterium]|nr:hypothetical protein BAC3_01712 [uncultured bacterium]
MILAVDVGYSETTALAAGVLFKEWDSDECERIVTVNVENVAAYESGSFYKRELPCILKLLEAIEDEITCIVIDGYVSLGTDHKGLGMYLWNSLAGEMPVIGVAKSRFQDTPEQAEIYRGGSLRPLYISSIGINLDEAKINISKMKGDFRIPTLLKLADQVSRGNS